MRGTGYISTEVNRYGVSNARANKRVIKRRPMGESYKDRDGQMFTVERTLEDVRTPICRYHSRAGVNPVEALPLSPDFKI